MKRILSYKDWVNTMVADSVQLRTYAEYMKYVQQQYSEHSNGIVTGSSNTDTYVQFMSGLKDLFGDGTQNDMLNSLDYSNDSQIKLAIPIYAEYLKNISQSLGNQRKDPKNTAAGYSEIDSKLYLEGQIYSKIAEKMVSDQELMLSEYSLALSGLSVETEELYDSHTYFDKDPILSASSYYDVSANSSEYESISNVSNALLNWTLQSGINGLVSNGGNSSLLSDSIDYSADGETKQTFYNTGFSSAFLGENQYTIDTLTKRPVLSIEANSPANNALNRYFPTIAMIPLLDKLYSQSDVGGYMLPKNMGVSIYHGKNRNLTSFTYEFTKSQFPNPIAYSNGLSLTRIYQSTPIYYNPTLNWIDIKYHTIESRGLVGNSKVYQEMIPYKTEYERLGRNDVGISRIIENVDPWTGIEDSDWSNPELYPPDFRKVYNVSVWKEALTQIGGYEFNWGVDAFGVNYALYKRHRAASEYNFKNSATGEIFVRGIDGYIVPFSMLFFNTWRDSAFWPQSPKWPDIGNFFDVDFQKLKEMQIYYDMLLVVGESGCAVVQNVVTGANGLPQIDMNSGYNFNYDVGLSVQDTYEHFDHFYDDRTNTLYVVTSKLIDGSVQLKLYSWKDKIPRKILDTSLMTDEYVTTLSLSAYDGTIMDLNDERNELVMSFVGYETNKNYIINVIYNLANITNTANAIVVEMDPQGNGTDKGNEPTKLLDINYFDNNLLFVIEGQSTLNKYLQIMTV